MLVKGVLKNKVLSTEIGSFHVCADDGNDCGDLESGVFELSQIKASSLDRSVTVEGYKTNVQIPITHAVIINAYALVGMKKYTNQDAKEHNQVQGVKLNQEQGSNASEEKKVDTIAHQSKSSEINSVENSNSNSNYISPHLDDEIALFGKPISELGDTYKPDKSMKQDSFKRIFSYLERRGCAYNASSRSWDLTGMLL